MSIHNSSVYCRVCGFELEENTSCSIDARKPCPRCGSKTRKFHVVLQGSVTFKNKLKMKARHPEGGKPFMEQISGDDFHRMSGKWMKLNRIIDRNNDLYHEVIIDLDTGNVIHECREPLSEHQGHGSAKRKNKKAVKR